VQSREARQDLALVTLLQALPEDRLARVLTGIGIEAEKIEERAQKADPRRCKVCGLGFVRCRALDEKAPADDRHPWSPDRTRSGEPLLDRPNGGESIARTDSGEGAS
jgi:hypothetical protein